jgi:hypothetical protein
MRIGIVGGLDRSAHELGALALAEGHRLETHTGVLCGSASATALRALVARCDLVLIVTDVNSHNAVRLARRLARVQKRPLRIMRRLGPSQLGALLRGLGGDELPSRQVA